MSISRRVIRAPVVEPELLDIADDALEQVITSSMNAHVQEAVVLTASWVLTAKDRGPTHTDILTLLLLMRMARLGRLEIPTA
jgi:hypothetical protein